MKQTEKVAVIILHAGCDLDCAFCITESAYCLGFREAIDLLERLFSEGIANVVLGGGEPFLWPHDVAKLARRAKDIGFFVQVGTNGTNVPKGFESMIGFDRWVLPLESDDPAIHDRMRPGADGSHHAVILDRLDRLRRANRSVTVSTVVTRWNVDALPDLARFLETYEARGGNLHAWHLYRFIPEGRGGRVNAETLSIDADAYHRACDAVREAHPDLTVFKRPDMYRSKTVAFHGATGPRPARDYFLSSPVP